MERRAPTWSVRFAYCLLMPRRRRSLTTMTMVIAAFAIVAMHIGMADHTMAMTSMEMSTPASSEVASMAHTVEPTQSAGTTSGRTASTGHGQQSPGAMTIAMVCQLLVLVTAAGYVLRHLVARRSRDSADLAPTEPVLEHPHRGLRPARPPGLTMLCVAIC